MHIMHLVTRLLRAGSEENTVETCRYQAEIGHQVSLVHGHDCDPYWHDNPIKGVQIIALPEMVHPINLIADIKAFCRLRQLFMTMKPDVIHTHQSKAGILGRLASRVLPHAFVVHGIHIVPFEGVGRVKRTLYILAERWAASRTNLFIGVSKAVGQSFIKAGIACPKNIHCVRSGIRLETFRNAEPNIDKNVLLAASTPISLQRVALMMAAFEPRKRHVLFLEAFAKIRHEVPDLKLLLAGQGPEEAVIRQAIARLGLHKQVVLCGHRPDPEALFAIADVTVLTSQREGLPRVLVQSLVAGVPVILNDLPGVDEVLQSGQNGVIVATDDLEQTAAQMVRLVKDETALCRLSVGARKTDVSDWDMTFFGERITRLYRPCTRLAAE